MGYFKAGHACILNNLLFRVTMLFDAYIKTVGNMKVTSKI
jgi:hypothetical protein